VGSKAPDVILRITTLTFPRGGSQFCQQAARGGMGGLPKNYLCQLGGKGEFSNYSFRRPIISTSHPSERPDKITHQMSKCKLGTVEDQKWVEKSRGFKAGGVEMGHRGESDDKSILGPR